MCACKLRQICTNEWVNNSLTFVLEWLPSQINVHFTSIDSLCFSPNKSKSIIPGWVELLESVFTAFLQLWEIAFISGTIEQHNSKYMYIILRYKHHRNLSVIKQRTYLEKVFYHIIWITSRYIFLYQCDFQLLQQHLPVQR